MRNISNYIFILSFSFFAFNSSFAGVPDSAFSVDKKNVTIPNCTSADSDTDGDGWGWENFQSCHVGGSFEYIVHPDCESASSDPDGDGWGWENQKSCKVVSGEKADNEDDSLGSQAQINEEPALQENTDQEILETNFINLSYPSTSEVVIEFEFPEASPAFIEFGFNKDNLNLKGPVESNSLSYHKQTIRNLESGKTYYFAINSNGIRTEVSSFDVLSANENFNDEPEIAAASTNTSTVSLPPGSSGNFLPAVSQLDKSRDIDTGASALNYLQSRKGDVSGTTLTRVSSKNAFGSNSTHAYSKRQAWNVDETKLLVGSKILNASNYSILRSSKLSSERTWSTVDPNKLIGIYGVGIAEENATNGNTNVLHKFDGYQKCTFGDWEGSPSYGDRYVVVTCQNSNGDKDIISFDIQNRQVLNTIRARGDFNWAGFSISGDYVLVENNKPGSDQSDQELVRYDKNLKKDELPPFQWTPKLRGLLDN